MSLRRAAVAAASSLLLLFLLRYDDLGRLRRRAQVLFRSAHLDSNTRHLNGTVASGDRQFYVFLESARRKLPAGTPGVAIFGASPSSAALYLAAYHFAPTPVVAAAERVPAGWLLAVYGMERPPGWKVVAPVWKGALMAPAP